jgi:hypothetical protein
MMRNKKIFAFGTIIAFILAGALITTPAKDRNLKVLPKDISDEKLDSIMHTYTKALGTNCRFCHVPTMVFPDTLDFASDNEPMKENARNMMRMVIDINKKNFWFNKEDKPEFLHVVSCITCHHGEELPPQ